MVRIFKRGEGRVTFCTVKCLSTGEGFHPKERACICHGTVKRRTVARFILHMTLCTKEERIERMWLKIRAILQK